MWYFIGAFLIALQGVPELFGVENILLKIIGALGILSQAVGSLLFVIEFSRE